MRAQLGPPVPGAAPDPDEQNLELQKLAFEVSVRINRATPITPTSLVTLALLGTGDRSLTVPEVARSLRNLLDTVEARKLPATVSMSSLRSEEAVESTLQALVENGVLSCYAEGPEAVYVIGRGQELAAAYYRNSIIHFFVGDAICELALLHAAEPGAADDAMEAFWPEVMRLRDLLKFDFFFPEKDAFRSELAEELTRQSAGWENQIAEGAEAIHALVASRKPFSAHRTIRPFLETYQVVSEILARAQPGAAFDEGRFLDECMRLGRQLLLQRRIHSGASVSKVLFRTALRLAENRGLLALETPDLASRRAEFAVEIRDALRRTEAIAALAASRRAGLIP
jgi:glycerol-3-phosphate O-acyltransferase